jgi:hypothetical protein
MMCKFVSALLFSGLLFVVTDAAQAQQPQHNSNQGENYSLHRRGGYSYKYSDSINTYGDSRTVSGGGSEFRDPTLDRQSEAGPFDHGFFFDSAIGQHGGNAPYMH